MANPIGKISEAGHRGRLRDRFQRNGLDAFSDHEILELLLGLGTPRRDVKQQAKQLLARFGTLSSVLEAPAKLLLQVPGIGPVNLMALKIPHAVSRRYLREKIQNRDYVRSSSAVRTYLTHELRDRNREAFLVIFLNGQNRIIELRTLFEGSLTSSAIYPREVVRQVLDLDAAAVILVHNHPSGSLKPSIHDRKVTQKLQTALEAIDVRVLDHLIVGGNGFYSFADEDLL